MERRTTKIDGRWVRQLEQSEAEVQAVLDSNQFLASTGQRGGTGSANVKFLARVPAALYGQWTHDWRKKGGLRGTGMKCRDYVLLKISTPDYSKLTATPSGKTGFEAAARKLVFGFENRKLNVMKAPAPERHPLIWTKR